MSVEVKVVEKWYGRKTKWDKVKVGFSFLRNGRPCLALSSTQAVDLWARRVISYSPKDKVEQVLANTKEELKAFFDNGIDRDRAFKYLSLISEKDRVKYLTKLLKKAAQDYYNKGESDLSDYEYDYWVEILRQRNPKAALLYKTGAPVDLQKVKLPAPAGSLHKTLDLESIQKWAGAGRVLIATPKLDGSSVVLHYKNGSLVQAATRGDGIEGQDITAKILKIKNPPPRKVSLKKEFVVRAEAVLSEQDFLELVDQYGLDYRNPRNTVAGVLNAKQPNLEVLRRIVLYAYSILRPESGLPLLRDAEKNLKLLKKLGFTVPKWKKIKANPRDLEKLPQLYKELRPSGIAADGIVLNLNSPTKEELGFTTGTLNPKWARAWKPQLKPVTTTVEDVEWNVSRHGRLKPRVKIKPVEIEGVTITWVTGKNAQHIKEQGIGPGAKVAVIRSGEVIPEITAVLKKVKPALPSKCPVCGSKTVWQSVDLVCPNKKCPGRTERGLEHFFRVLDVPGAGPGTAKALLEAGYTRPEQLLEARPSDLQKILGPKKGKLLAKSLKEALKSVEAHRLALALGFFPAGYGLKKIAEVFRKKPTEWLDAIKATQSFAKRFGIKLVYPKSEEELKGVFVFTGYRDKELERTIKELGGEVSNTVNKNTTALFAKDPHGSSRKLLKARELGVPIVPATKAWDYVRKALS